jgi:exodeoxyribonuclease VII small subunit
LTTFAERIPVAKIRSKKRFEQMMAELEELVASMEQSPELEEAIASFEKGMALFRKCQGVLDDSERKVRLLRDGPGDAVLSESYGEGDQGNGTD